MLAELSLLLKVASRSRVADAAVNDVLQEAVTRAYRAWRKGQVTDDLALYLTVTVRILGIGLHRRRRSEANALARLAPMVEAAWPTRSGSESGRTSAGRWRSSPTSNSTARPTRPQCRRPPRACRARAHWARQFGGAGRGQVLAGPRHRVRIGHRHAAGPAHCAAVVARPDRRRRRRSPAPSRVVGHARQTIYVQSCRPLSSKPAGNNPPVEGARGRPSSRVTASTLRAMATIDRGAVPAHMDPQQDRPLRDVPATRLVERLERQFDRGEPYDDAVVFELATRAIDAEEGTAVATTF
jgi:hypothetical protein